MGGRLFAVVGPSGAGKDTLIEAARRARPDLYIARRVITRPESDGAEPYEGVTKAEFAARAASGKFALTWRAHGLFYGIPTGMAAALEAGQDAVFNCSRAVLEEAQARFPSLRVILVTALDETLAARLAARGRESAGDIRGRLARARFTLPPGLPVEVVRNDGPLEEAVAAFLRLLQPESAAR